MSGLASSNKATNQDKLFQAGIENGEATSSDHLIEEKTLLKTLLEYKGLNTWK